MASQVQLAIAVFAPDDIGNWTLDWIGLKAQCSGIPDRDTGLHS